MSSSFLESSLRATSRAALRARAHSRAFAADPRRPPLPAADPVVETFSETSRPRPYYAKHPQNRELPRSQKAWPILLAAASTGLAGWGAFMLYATNEEKLSSSVYRSILRSVKSDPSMRQALGEAIRPQPEWWLNGQPLINGHIGQLQGNIDVSFRLRGSKGSGTLYFTSVRKDKGVPFTILRFKVICDHGPIIHVESPGSE